MAFQLGVPIGLPSDISGLYLLPLYWLKYGLDHKEIIIKDNHFYDTLQGSIFMEYEDYINEGYVMFPNHHEWRKVESEYTYTFNDLYQFFIFNGDGKYYPVKAQMTEDDKYLYDIDNEKFYSDTDHVTTPGNYKFPVYVGTLQYIKTLKPMWQKNYNAGLLQLFKGCGLKLVHGVWNLDDVR